MSNISVRPGNLLDVNTTYICHQCNCVTTSAAGLARSIFHEYPYSDIYSSRVGPSTPGTISIHGDGSRRQRKIVNMFAQYNPGKPSANETKEMRLQWFDMCLKELTSHVQPGESIAFPYLIGCDMAGGDWNDYMNLLILFALSLPDNKIYLIARKI